MKKDMVQLELDEYCFVQPCYAQFHCGTLQEVQEKTGRVKQMPRNVSPLENGKVNRAQSL